MTYPYRWSPGLKIGNNYVIEKPIAHGGMGEVYRGRHETLLRPVAIKTIRGAAAQKLEACGRFMREAQVLAQIKHDNVVDIYDFGEHEGTWFMVMEWLDGETLATRQQNVTTFKVGDLVRVLVEACAAVAAVHAIDVVHRDLKPDNVFLVRDREGRERVKVVDFGIASAGELGPDGVYTGRNLMGTPCYMSPEQWKGPKDLPAASDQFSLGVIAYECATGPASLRGGRPDRLVRPLREGAGGTIQAHPRAPFEPPPDRAPRGISRGAGGGDRSNARDEPGATLPLDA